MTHLQEIQKYAQRWKENIFYYITHLSVCVLIKIYFKYEAKIRHVPKAPSQNPKSFIEYTQETTGLVKRTWYLESDRLNSNPGSDPSVLSKC